MKLIFFAICSFLTLTCSWAIAQEHGYDTENIHTHQFKHHRLAIIIGHGHVFGAENIGSGKKIITIPTWGFDYQYWLNSTFGVGLKSDIEIMDYVITINNDSRIERNNPIIVSAIFLYHPSKGWNLFAGPGIEIEESHNFFILRAGMSYEFEFGNHWDFSPEFIFDLKDAGIGAFTWGIGVGKRF